MVTLMAGIGIPFYFSFRPRSLAAIPICWPVIRHVSRQKDLWDIVDGSYNSLHGTIDGNESPEVLTVTHAFERESLLPGLILYIWFSPFCFFPIIVFFFLFLLVFCWVHVFSLLFFVFNFLFFTVTRYFFFVLLLFSHSSLILE